MPRDIASRANPESALEPQASGPLALIPAAQYVRMSDETQQYSPDNQKDAIQQYAAQHGFRVVKTYADLGKSGVIARNRTGLSELLKDVVSGEAEYKAILVYDVSRWGRYPNSDEAAITSTSASVQAYLSITVPSRLQTMEPPLALC